MVYIYTVGYMADDPATALFSYISHSPLPCLFEARHNLYLFMGRRGFGSLSGFWFKRDTATFESLKAFLNQVGTWAFFWGSL